MKKRALYKLNFSKERYYKCWKNRTKEDFIGASSKKIKEVKNKAKGDIIRVGQILNIKLNERTKG